jgi:formiminotetrahydrofolate cyclodeaminase
MATARSASYNVRVNLSSAENVSDRSRFKSETEAMLAHAIALIQRVSPKIWNRVPGD